MNTHNAVLYEKEEICMKIKLKNIAKIIEADINMDGISIIAGKNNIGKSTILKSIYVAVNSFRNSNKKILNEHKRSLYSIIMRFDQYFDDKGYEYLPQSLLIDFYNTLSKNILSLSESRNRFSEVKRCFHEALDNYEKFLQQDNSIYSDEFFNPLYNKIEEVFNRPKEMMLKFISNMYITGTFNNQINFISDISLASIDIDSVNGHNIIEIKDNKVERITSNSVNEPDAIYLPTFSILDIINHNYIKTVYSPEGSIRGYLKDISNADMTFEKYTEIEDNLQIVKEILDDVVNGNLRMTSNGNIIYDDDDLDVSVNMENVASGIKNFILIKKLVENGILKKNSILLIDEPETNLHPEWHLKFAEILILMYKNMGVVSVVTSHSPYFIRALEVMMANYGIKDKGSFYLMKETTKSRYIAENVTKNTERIYELLYKPLENL